ncbi:MAG: hypothetical protein EOP04_03590 [Proteobacteria bacterium]|nr:MAG: hypothetical protein EOP04_03590 [Pseudomonadota bacterium]
MHLKEQLNRIDKLMIFILENEAIRNHVQSTNQEDAKWDDVITLFRIAQTYHEMINTRSFTEKQLEIKVLFEATRLINMERLDKTSVPNSSLALDKALLQYRQELSIIEMNQNHIGS